ncbi:MarR family winged helix-turn-helix transcriptional regulator [Nonomuraea endophytica]|uniref:MarR family winged helix-turn-helix transcriptional regulator n=1 Tax=Nonomuraea endophytica TaxID=714136 RepID=UPI0037C9BEE7
MSKDPKDEPARELTGELFELSMALDLIGNASAGQIGINQTDLMCLNLLVRHGPMSPGQIAAALGLTTAAISAMASRLEAGGYAAREIDPKDRRRVLMHASPLGAERAFGLFDDFFLAATELFGSTSEDDLRRLADLLRRFRHLLTEHAQVIRDRPK